MTAQQHSLDADALGKVAYEAGQAHMRERYGMRTGVYAWSQTVPPDQDVYRRIGTAVAQVALEAALAHLREDLATEMRRARDAGVLARWGQGYEDAIGELMDFARQAGLAERPTIVVLCGSTRFSEAFREANLRETLAGRIVLSVGCDMRGDDDVFAHMSDDEKAATKVRLDELHLRKVDLADEVLILDVDGYVGESTGRELAYARAAGKVVRFLSEEREQQS